MQRAIVGASLEVIRAKRNQKPEVRAAAREAALRELKEKKRKEKAARKAARANLPRGGAAPKAIKQTRGKGR